MLEHPSRRRAPAMNSDARRTAIVQATLPLLAEHGAGITTRQIAHAAGIAEGTVFRVFSDKDELVRTCITEAFRTDEVCAEIRNKSAERDIETRLAEAGLLFLEHRDRMGELMQTLATSGYDVRQHRPKPTNETAREGPERFMGELSSAIASLLAEDAHRFRMPLEDTARMFLGLLLSIRFEPGTPNNRRADVAQRVDVLLRGALG